MGILPEILFNFIGGITGDIFNKKYINIVSDFIRAVILLLFLHFVDLSSSEYMYSLALLKVALSFIGVFVAPAIDGIIPEIVLPENLLKFNMKYTLFLDVIDIIAPLTVGFIYLTLGMHHVLVLDILSFIISGTLFCFIELEKIVSSMEIEKKIKFFLNRGINLILIENFLFSLVIYPVLDIYIIYYFTKVLGFSDFKYGQYQSLLYLISIVTTLLLFKKIEKISKKRTYIFLILALGMLSLFQKKMFFCFIAFVVLDNVSKFIRARLDTKLQLISPQSSFAKISSIYWTVSSIGVITGNFILSNAIDKNLISAYYTVIVVIVSILLLINSIFLKRQ